MSAFNFQLELQTESGHLTLSILLFQDIAAVPFLALIPILAQGGNLGLPIAITLFKGIAVLIGILILGRWLLRPLFHFVASTRSAELFTLVVLLTSMSAAWLTHFMGLSLAFGAFLAGMMLSETEYRHQIEIEIRPFKDVLLGLFFIAVGMQLDFSTLTDIWPLVLALLVGVVFGKGFLIFILLKMANYSTVTSMRTGQNLAHAGEFGIALLVLAVITGVISPQDNHPILLTVILSMMLAPLLIRFSNTLAMKLFGQKLAKPDEDYSSQISQSVDKIENHVVICGFGRVGQVVAEHLIEQDIMFIGLDTNPSIVKKSWQEHEQVFFGDATNSKILEAAKIENAKALVICVDDSQAALNILRTARRLSQDIPMLVRTSDESMMEQLLDAGANEIIPETLEAGTMMITQLLLLLNKPVDEVYEQIKMFRSKRYPILDKFYRGDKNI